MAHLEQLVVDHLQERLDKQQLIINEQQAKITRLEQKLNKRVCETCYHL
jgi:hypothetical protein